MLSFCCYEILKCFLQLPLNSVAVDDTTFNIAYIGTCDACAPLFWAESAIFSSCLLFTVITTRIMRCIATRVACGMSFSAGAYVKSCCSLMSTCIRIWVRLLSAIVDINFGHWTYFTFTIRVRVIWVKVEALTITVNSVFGLKKSCWKTWLVSCCNYISQWLRKLKAYFGSVRIWIPAVWRSL